MTNELSVEEIADLLITMAKWSALDGCERDVVALVADWRKRGDALTLAQADYEIVLNSYVAENQQLHDRAEIAEKELEALSESHKDLSHRLARLREALSSARPFVNLAVTQEQAEASPRWYSKAVTSLSTIDAALRPKS